MWCTVLAIGRDELRRANVGAVLSRVHLNGPTSRAVLTGELGLNRSTIGDIAAQLEALGLVTEAPSPQHRRSGRPSHLVVPREDVTVLAVALDVDRIVIALVSLGGTVLERRERPHQRGSHDVGLVVVSVSQVCRELLANAAGSRCIGVGVSVPGAVRDEDGLVRFAPNLGWVDAPFAQLLTAELGLPVLCDNDANLGVLAEHMRGAAVGVKDCAYLSGSVGIGGGFLVDGVPLRGVGGYAGEIGHLMVDVNGERCRCGAYGCWETLVGENQLLEGAGRLAGGGLAAVVEVIEAAAAGEKRAARSLTECARWTGVGLSAIVTVFNPAMIVLSGVLAQVWTARSGQIGELMRVNSMIARREEVAVVPALLGSDSSLIGAAEIAFAPLLADPLRLNVAA
jgi:predicted NBD/HSP70 family sugar kinase